MRSSDLTREQSEKLAAQIGPMLNYVNRLIKRMDKLGWEPHDPLYYLSLRAQGDLQGLLNTAQRASVKHEMYAHPDTKDRDRRRA